MKCLLVFLVAVAAYWNTLDHPVDLYDDRVAVADNPDVVSTRGGLLGLDGSDNSSNSSSSSSSGGGSSSSFWAHDFWGQDMASALSHKSYRPLTVLTFRLSLRAAGGLACRWCWHLPNVLLHATAASLVTHLAGHILSFPSSRARSPLPALAAGLVFALHPVNTEAVNTLVGRADLLSGVLFLLALWAHTSDPLGARLFRCLLRGGRAADSGGDGLSTITSRAALGSLARVTLTVILAACAMLCKEQGISVIGLCLATDILKALLLYNSSQGTQAQLSSSTSASPSTAHTSQTPPRRTPSPSWLVPMFLIMRAGLLTLGGAIVLVHRLRLNGNSKPHFEPWQNPASHHPSMLVRAATYITLGGQHAALLFNPAASLCYNWAGTDCVPLVLSLDDRRLVFTLGALVLSATLLITAVFSLARTSRLNQRRRSRRWRFALLVSAAWILVSFLPASNLLFPVGFVLAERVLYVPAMGASLLLGLAASMPKSSRARRAMHAALVLLFSLCAWRVFVRNTEWRDFDALSSSGLRVCPRSGFVVADKMQALLAKGHVDTADVLASSYISSLPSSLHDSIPRGLRDSLASIHLQRGRLDEAERVLRLVVESHEGAQSDVAHVNHAHALERIGRAREAGLAIDKAIQLGLFRRGAAAMQQPSSQLRASAQALATRVLQDLIVRHSATEAAKRLLLLALGEGQVCTGESAQALLGTLHHAGSEELRGGRYADAAATLTVYLQCKPLDALAWEQLGGARFYLQDLPAAHAAYKRSLELNPNSDTVQRNLRVVEEALEANE